jgi:hypothetical protein
LAIIDFTTVPIHGISCLVTMMVKDGAKPGAVPASLQLRLQEEDELGMGHDFFYVKFSCKAYFMRDWVRHHIFALKDAGYSIGMYGAAAKGMVLLNFLAAREHEDDPQHTRDTPQAHTHLQQHGVRGDQEHLGDSSYSYLHSNYSYLRNRNDENISSRYYKDDVNKHDDNINNNNQNKKRLLEAINFVVDDAALKQQRYCPGTRIPVMPTSYLNARADTTRLAVVVLAWNFWDEIKKRMLTQLERANHSVMPVILPFPNARVVFLNVSSGEERQVAELPYSPTAIPNPLAGGPFSNRGMYQPSSDSWQRSHASNIHPESESLVNRNVFVWRKLRGGKHHRNSHLELTNAENIQHNKPDNMYGIVSYPYGRHDLLFQNNIYMPEGGQNSLRAFWSLFSGTSVPVPARRRTLLITHIYNEEMLLPYFIRHHAGLFDHAIVIDFGSTDSSRQIIAREAPSTWKIVNATHPERFAAEEADKVCVYMGACMCCTCVARVCVCVCVCVVCRGRG